MLRRILGEDIEIVVELDPGLGIAEADPGQMQQLLVNLTAGQGHPASVRAHSEVGQGTTVRMQAIRPSARLLLMSGHADTNNAFRDPVGHPIHLLAKPLAPERLARKANGIHYSHRHPAPPGLFAGQAD